MDTLIFMTVSASLLLLAAFALRALFGRVLPRRSFMALWCAASVRLLVPLEVALPVSVFALFARKPSVVQAVQHPNSVPVTPVVPIPTAPPTAAAPVATAAPVVVPAAEPLQFVDVLPWIWAAGAVLLASALLFVHLRERYRCRFMMRDFEAEALVPHRVRVYRCAAVSAPYVTGLFRPQILLPAEFDKADLQPVLAHELAHIRGLDILKKMLFAAALCVNWFNPLVWVMVRLAGRDLELLCDERALRDQDAPARAAYAHALLNAEERRSVFTLGFKSDTEVRIMNVLKGKKHNRLTALLSVLLVLLTVAACTSTPMAQETTPEPHSDATIGGADAPEAEKLSMEEADDPEISYTAGGYQFGSLRWGMTREEAEAVVGSLTEIRVYDEDVTPPYVTWAGAYTTSLMDFPGQMELYFYDGVLMRALFHPNEVSKGSQLAVYLPMRNGIQALFGKATEVYYPANASDDVKDDVATYAWINGVTRMVLSCDINASQTGLCKDVCLSITDTNRMGERIVQPTPEPESTDMLVMESCVLKGRDELLRLQEQIPNTEGADCRRILVKRTRDDSVIGELIVPTDKLTDYLEKAKSLFYFDCAYCSVSFA